MFGLSKLGLQVHNYIRVCNQLEIQIKVVFCLLSDYKQGSVGIREVQLCNCPSHNDIRAGVF